MKIFALTLFPELFESYAKHGLVEKAIKKRLIDIQTINYRDFATDSHRTVDDIPYGGGSGMLIKPEPVIKAFLSIPEEDRKDAEKIVLSARGKVFNQLEAEKLSSKKTLIFFAGRYKGFDQRIVDLMEATEISIGDYIVQGGELATLIIIDSVIRLLPGFMNDDTSFATDSFAGGSQLLSAPDYTRPYEFAGLRVPDVLVSGNHEQISKWRRRESLRITMERRPDLIPLAKLDDEDFKILEEIADNIYKEEEKKKLNINAPPSTKNGNPQN